MDRLNSRLHLLVVEDDDIDRERLRRALESAGVDASFEERDTLDGALDALGAAHFDCMILDYNLPGADGREVMKVTRDYGFDVPVIVLTGQGDERLAVEMMRAGAADYLSKNDLAPEQLTTSLRRALRVHQAEEQARAAQARLEAERALLQEVLTQMPAGLVVAEAPGGKMLLSNNQLEHLLGAPYVTLSAEEGHAPPYRALRPDGARYAAEDWPLGRSLRSGEVIQAETIECERADGTQVILEASAGPVRDPRGDIVAAVMTLHDVTRQKKAEEELQRALSARDDVLAFVSHDLRNPLNNIYLAAQLLREAVTPGSFEEKPVSSIIRGVKKADRLIQDLLDVSSSESGGLKLERELEQPEALVQQAIEDHVAEAAKRSVRLEVDEAPDLPGIPVDRQRILRVLGNLLSNAIRFTPEHGAVTVSASATAGGVQLCVADSGPGIEEAHLEHVFDRYWQARRQDRSGAGLGLAIARGIVLAHGGRIWVESKLGEGCRFMFELPREPPALRAP